jgi:hypothetical protein
VGPQCDLAPLYCLVHQGEVVFENVKVKDKRRRIDVRERHTN